MSNIQQQLEQKEEALAVALAQQKDADAFRKLVELYDRRLLYFARRLLGECEEAFDAVQSTWLQVHRSLHQLASPQAFRVWLYKIAHAQVVTLLRKQSGQRHLIMNDVEASEVPDNFQDVSLFDNAEQVHVALQDLSVDHRRVLVLRFLEDMSVEEIAEVLACSSGTVKSRLHYAKEALRKRIEELES